MTRRPQTEEELEAETHGYQYEVFISYSHEKHQNTWVNKVLVPLLELHLPNAGINPKPEIYSDKLNRTGLRWGPAVDEALACSRIMVPVWSIQYFNSPNCRREYAIMLNREEQLGFMERPDSLIVPVQLFDGEWYPPITEGILTFDCRKYNNVLKTSAKYAKLQKKVEDWAEDIAQSVMAAPDWQPEWLTPAWLDEPAKRWEADPRFMPRNIKSFRLLDMR